MKAKPKNKKTAIVVTTPFGYGPTSATLGFIELFSKKWKGEIVFASRGLTREILPRGLEDRITTQNIDQRNIQELYELFIEYDKPYIVSFQNKLAITVANDLKLHNALIDVLGWFWTTAPTEYRYAEHYFYLRFPFLNSNVADYKNSKAIGAPLGLLPDKNRIKTHTVVNLGGIQNHMTDSLPEAYLNILSEILNDVDIEVSVLTSHACCSYLKKRVKNPKIDILTLPLDSFLDLLSKTKNFVTTAGVIGTMQAFALGVPATFILPTNLSQWKLEKIIKEFDAENSCIMWEDFMNIDSNLDKYSETEALRYFDNLGKASYKNKRIRYQIKSRYLRVIGGFDLANPNQYKMLEEIGKGGTETICKKLISSWGK